MGERYFAVIDGAGNGRGRARFRSGGERNVALAGEKSRGGIETDPASAGKINFGPGVQVGKILRGSRLAFERQQVGLQLNQVTGDEAGGESQVTQNLDEQPGAIAARSAAEREALLAGLDARLHANQILNPALDLLV